MFVLVTYDVATTTVEGRRRLRRVEHHGQRPSADFDEALIV